MPACRQMSLTGTPASACLRIETIWVSVKRDFFMEPPGWGKHARKFYLWGVCGSGKLTVESNGPPANLSHQVIVAPSGMIYISPTEAPPELVLSLLTHPVVTKIIAKTKKITKHFREKFISASFQLINKPQLEL